LVTSSQIDRVGFRLYRLRPMLRISLTGSERIEIITCLSYFISISSGDLLKSSARNNPGAAQGFGITLHVSDQSKTITKLLGALEL